MIYQRIHQPLDQFGMVDLWLVKLTSQSHFMYFLNTSISVRPAPINTGRNGYCDTWRYLRIIICVWVRLLRLPSSR